MTPIPFVGSPGAFFNRLGKLGLAVGQVSTYQAAQYTNYTSTTTGIVSTLNAESDIQSIAGSGYQGVLNGAGTSLGGNVQQLAAAICNRVVFRSNPRINQTLQDANTVASLQEIIYQMRTQGQTVLAMVISATPTQFTAINTNVGNGVVTVSTRSPFTGLVYENTYGETVQVLCSADSYVGGTAQGNEGFTLTGVGSDSSPFDFNWPLGSNGQAGVNAIDGDTDNGNGNILTNSSFDSWTASVPDDWTLVVGVPGTNIAQDTGNTYDPTGSALKIIGANNALTEITQEFGSDSGTLGTLTPQTQYSVNIFMRRDGTAPGAGIWTIDIVDQNGGVIKDASNVANTFNVDLTALSTNYAAFNLPFRTPLVLPSQQFLRMRLTTALTNSRTIYIDKLSMGAMTQLYLSGPYFAVHAGSIPFNQGDYALIVMQNSRGVGGTLNSFQTLIFRCLPQIMQTNELQFPSSASPSVSDTLIS